jgi:hypothetical protein
MAWNLPPGHQSAKGDLYGKRMSRVQQHREDGRAYSDEGRKVRSAWLARAILAAVVVLLVVGQECRESTSWNPAVRDTVTEFRAMHQRIRFINQEGKEILLVDFSNCSANEVEEIARIVPDYVTVRPRSSVLVLTDFSGASV